jgi:hypothetical protein
LIEIIKALNIEVSKPNIFQAVVAKQYDMNTRFIKATLVDGPDVIYIPNDPDRSVKVVINAERPDGQSKGFDGVVNDDGTVTVPLHSWMLEMEGTVICDISVIDTEADDNKKLTTTTFTLLVEKAAYGGSDVTNDPQYDVLVSLLETCQEASVAAEEALEKSNEANSKYDACVEATENANAASEELENIKEELADGGFITGLKESNEGDIFRIWSGTQEQYDSLEEKPENTLCLIEDDNTLDVINQKIDKLSVDYSVETGTKSYFDNTWIYEKRSSGVFKLYGSLGCTPINLNSSGYTGTLKGVIDLSLFPLQISKISSCLATITYLDPNALEWSDSWNIKLNRTTTEITVYIQSPTTDFGEKNSIQVDVEVVGILKQEG